MFGFDLTDVASFLIGRMSAGGDSSKLTDFLKSASEWPIVGGFFKGLADMVEKHAPSDSADSNNNDNDNENGAVDAARDPEAYLAAAVKPDLTENMRNAFDTARANSPALQAAFAASIQDIRADLADDNEIEASTLAREVEEVTLATHIAMAGEPQGLIESSDKIKFSEPVTVNENHWHVLGGAFETKHMDADGTYNPDQKGLSGSDELSSVLGESIEVRRVFVDGSENGYFFSSADSDGNQHGFFVLESALNLDALPENMQDKLKEIDAPDHAAASPAFNPASPFAFT